ncbi:MAG: hypothetical protein IPM41_06385 [Sphingomonadales bacterium]|nr:hypothetical protein [Sphingomonadales bacterium]
MTFEQDFTQMRALAGWPVLTCVKPRSAWTSIPSGYTFDASYDAYINSGGTIWKPTSSADLNAADYATVAVLPGAGSLEKSLTAAGLVDQGERFGRILPTSLATVQAAQWLELDGMTYDLAEATPYPAGAALWYILRLRKR